MTDKQLSGERQQRIARALAVFPDLAQNEGNTAKDVRTQMEAGGFTGDEIRVAALVYGEMHTNKSEDASLTEGKHA